MSNINLSDAQVEAFIHYLETDTTPGAQDRLLTLRSILACVAFQAAHIDTLERLAQLDDAVASSISSKLSKSYTVDRLREVFGTPASTAADLDAATSRIAALESDIKNAANASALFTTVAKFGVAAAKAFA